MILYTGSLSQREFIGVTRALRSGRDKVAIESLLKKLDSNFLAILKIRPRMYEPLHIYIHTHTHVAQVSSTLIKKISIPIVVKLQRGNERRKRGHAIESSRRGGGKFFAKKMYLNDF